MQEVNEKEYLLGFSLIPNIGPAKYRKIKDFFSSFESAWKSSHKEDFIKAGIQKDFVDKLFLSKEKIDLQKEQQKLIENEIEIVTQADDQYPELLKEIKTAPYLLFCKGNLDLLKTKQLAIVGTRMPTSYAIQVAEKIIPEISAAGLTITSGLAVGTDILAHQFTLENNGKTIAVLGSGLDQENLRRNGNSKIADEIFAKEGLIISEYPLGFPANKHTFPARNRIISGLSVGTLVIEAGQKSGSLITANYALEQNREIFAVPGNIFSPQSQGTNYLIKNGAKVVTSVNDILEAFNFHPLTNPLITNIEFDDPIEKNIYQKLSFEPLHIDKIAKLSALDTVTVSMKLSMMELKGIVKNVGGRFIKN